MCVQSNPKKLSLEQQSVGFQIPHGICCTPGYSQMFLGATCLRFYSGPKMLSKPLLVGRQG